MTKYAVYRIYDDAGVLLYVGCTGNLPIRMATHRRMQPWSDRIARVEHEMVECREYALDRERDLITAMDPLFNIVHTSRDPRRGPRRRRVPRTDELSELLRRADRRPSWLARKLGVSRTTMVRWGRDGIPEPRRDDVLFYLPPLPEGILS